MSYRQPIITDVRVVHSIMTYYAVMLRDQDGHMYHATVDSKDIVDGFYKWTYGCAFGIRRMWAWDPPHPARKRIRGDSRIKPFLDVAACWALLNHLASLRVES